MHWDTLIDTLAQWFEQRGLLTRGARLVLGVSGGPDSTLMLYGLRDLSQQRELGWSMRVAHLHHGMRGRDADLDAEFVEQIARELGFPFDMERANIPQQVAEAGGSTEEVARNHRYEFLERVALRTGCDWVAVAHHADDNAETVLHRIFRGTGMRGLAGMRDMRPIRPGSRITLLRPLIQLRRANVEVLCAERKIPSRVDPTNFNPIYTRARIRNEVLPLIRKAVNPNVTDAVLRLAEQARWLGNYLEDSAARVFDSLVISEQPRHIVLNARALLAKPRIIQAEVLRRAIALVMGGEQELGFSHIEAALKLAADRGSGKELHLPGAVQVRKVYERLEIQPIAEEAEAVELPPAYVHCPGVSPLPALHAELLTEVRDVDDGILAAIPGRRDPLEEWVDFERVRPPLLVRGRREGDRFWPLGSPGPKTLSDFFIDEKLDPAVRPRTGVLCDQNGPLWVIPLRIDERVKLRPTTRRALRLLLRPEAPRGDGA